MLTEPGDLVVDIFAGSNTAGWVAESEKRRWLAFDESAEYVAASAFRFLSKSVEQDTMRELHTRIRHGESVDLAHHGGFGTLLESAVQIEPEKPLDDPTLAFAESRKLIF